MMTMYRLFIMATFLCSCATPMVKKIDRPYDQPVYIDSLSLRDTVIFFSPKSQNVHLKVCDVHNQTSKPVILTLDEYGFIMIPRKILFYVGDSTGASDLSDYWHYTYDTIPGASLKTEYFILNERYEIKSGEIMFEYREIDSLKPVSSWAKLKF